MQEELTDEPLLLALVFTVIAILIKNARPHQDVKEVESKIPIVRVILLRYVAL